MTVYELIQKLAEFSPDTEVAFQSIVNDELELDIEDVEIDGNTVTIPQHGAVLVYRNIIRHNGLEQCPDEIIINLRPSD